MQEEALVDFKVVVELDEAEVAVLHGSRRALIGFGSGFCIETAQVCFVEGEVHGVLVQLAQLCVCEQTLDFEIAVAAEEVALLQAHLVFFCFESGHRRILIFFYFSAGVKSGASLLLLC